MHIPKSGGITVERSLKVAFPDARVCPRYNVPEYREYRYSAADSYDLYLGHFNDDFMRTLPAECIRTLVVRDPLARLVSQYNHIGTRDAMKTHTHLSRRHTQFASGNMSFSQAVRKLGGFKNLITRFIVGHSEYYRILKNTPDTEVIRVFKAAVRRKLAEFHVVGLTEDLAAFGMGISRAIGRNVDITGHHNRNPASLIEAKDLTDRDISVFAKNNSVDLATYALIKQRDFEIGRVSEI